MPKTYERPAIPEGTKLDHITEDLRVLAVPVEDLTEDPRNARRHPARNLDATAESLAGFTQRKPIVVNAKGAVVEAGNGTLQVARRLGWTHVAAVLVVDDAKTARAYSIADNRVAELSEWDAESLLAGLQEVQGEFDLEALGFDADILEELAGDPDETEEPGAPIAPDTRFVAFKFGAHGGQVSRELYDAFVDRLKKLRASQDAPTLDDVLRAWLKLGGTRPARKRVKR